MPLESMTDPVSIQLIMTDPAFVDCPCSILLRLYIESIEDGRPVTRVTRDPSRSRVAVLDYCPSSTRPDAAGAQLHAAGREHVWTTRQSPDLDVDTQPVASATTVTAARDP